MGNFFNSQGKRKLECDDNEEIRELKRMLAEKEETIYDTSVRKLFECGIPKILLVQSIVSNKKTPYTSKHEPAEFALKSFQTIDGLQTNIASINADSFTLVRCKNRKVHKYSTEADIGTFVKEVLEDTAVLSGLPDIDIFGIPHSKSLRTVLS